MREPRNGGESREAHDVIALAWPRIAAVAVRAFVGEARPRVVLAEMFDLLGEHDVLAMLVLHGLPPIASRVPVVSHARDAILAFVARSSECPPAAALRMLVPHVVPLLSPARDFGYLLLDAGGESPAGSLLSTLCATLLDTSEPRGSLQSLHRQNNVIAALLSNVDYIDTTLRGASPDLPLLEKATLEDRAELLCAVRNAAQSGRALMEITKGHPEVDALESNRES